MKSLVTNIQNTTYKYFCAMELCIARSTRFDKLKCALFLFGSGSAKSARGGVRGVVLHLMGEKLGSSFGWLFMRQLAVHAFRRCQRNFNDHSKRISLLALYFYLFIHKSAAYRLFALPWGWSESRTERGGEREREGESLSRCSVASSN